MFTATATPKNSGNLFFKKLTPKKLVKSLLKKFTPKNSRDETVKNPENIIPAPVNADTNNTANDKTEVFVYSRLYTVYRADNANYKKAVELLSLFSDSIIDHYKYNGDKELLEKAYAKNQAHIVNIINFVKKNPNFTAVVYHNEYEMKMNLNAHDMALLFDHMDIWNVLCEKTTFDKKAVIQHCNEIWNKNK